MNDLDLTDLDLRIDALISDRRHLKMENHSLRQKLFKLTQERALLQDKNLTAASMTQSSLPLPV